MLYKKKSNQKLDLTLFKNPPQNIVQHHFGRGTVNWNKKNWNGNWKCLRKWALAVRICMCVQVWQLRI